jgi:hypothetical protein
MTMKCQHYRKAFFTDFTDRSVSNTSCYLVDIMASLWYNRENGNDAITIAGYRSCDTEWNV